MIMTPRWRDEFKVEDAMKETCPGVFNGFGHVYGHHKEARPVVCATFPPSCRLSGPTVHAVTIYTVAIMTSQLLSATSGESSGTSLNSLSIVFDR
jgi:hypothetical protein